MKIATRIKLDCIDDAISIKNELESSINDCTICLLLENETWGPACYVEYDYRQPFILRCQSVWYDGVMLVNRGEFVKKIINNIKEDGS